MSTALKVAVDVDTMQLDAWLIKKATAMGVGLGGVLREEASFLLETVARITPPTDGSMSIGQSWALQKKMGRNAVIGDLARVYTTSSSLAKQIRESGEDGAENVAKAFSRSVRKSDIPEARRLLYAVGLGNSAAGNIGPFDASHHRSRQTRRGRVAGGSAASQVVTNSPALNEYKRAQLAKVGALKKGWVVAGSKLTRKPRIPAWISKSAGAAGGQSIDQTMRSLDPFITMVNTVPYAGVQNSVMRFGKIALNIREGKVKRSVEAMVKRNWKK